MRLCVFCVRICVCVCVCVCVCDCVCVCVCRGVCALCALLCVLCVLCVCRCALCVFPCWTAARGCVCGCRCACDAVLWLMRCATRDRRRSQRMCVQAQCTWRANATHQHAPAHNVHTCTDTRRVTKSNSGQTHTPPACIAHYGMCLCMLLSSPKFRVPCTSHACDVVHGTCTCICALRVLAFPRVSWVNNGMHK